MSNPHTPSSHEAVIEKLVRQLRSAQMAADSHDAARRAGVQVILGDVIDALALLSQPAPACPSCAGDGYVIGTGDTGDLSNCRACVDDSAAPAAEARLRELEDWKESALASLKRWHALADKLLPFAGVHLGEDIPTVLAERIPALLAAVPQANLERQINNLRGNAADHVLAGRFALADEAEAEADRLDALLTAAPVPQVTMREIEKHARGCAVRESSSFACDCEQAEKETR